MQCSHSRGLCLPLSVRNWSFRAAVVHGFLVLTAGIRMELLNELRFPSASGASGRD